MSDEKFNADDVKALLNGLNSQIQVKSEFMVNLSETIKVMEARLAPMQAELNAIEDKILAGRRKLEELDKALVARQSQWAEEVNPLRQVLETEKAKFEQEKADLALKSSRIKDAVRVFDDERTDINAHWEAIKKQKAVAEDLQRTVLTNRDSLQRVAVELDARKALIDRREAEITKREAAIKVREEASDKELQQARGAIGGIKAREDQAQARDNQLNTLEIALGEREKAVKKEEIRLQGLIAAVEAEKSSWVSRIKDLDSIRRDLEKKTMEVKYMELKLKKIAAEKGIADALEDLK